MVSTERRVDMASLRVIGEEELKELVEAFAENNIRRQMFGLLPPTMSIANAPELVMSATYVAATGEIVAAWTMFESLAADLWIAAVNAFPDPLAALSGHWKRLLRNGKKDSDDGDNAEESDSKSVSLAKIHQIPKGTYDIQHKMGDLLLASNRVKLISLDGIRKAYGSAFSQQYKIKPDRIDDALKAECLDCVNALRNVIVHRAGVADERYEADSRGISAAPQLKRGQKLSLVQEDARALAEPVADACVALMTAVDQWMKIKRGKSTT